MAMIEAKSADKPKRRAMCTAWIFSICDWKADALDCACKVLEYAFKSRPSQVVGHFFAAN